MPDLAALIERIEALTGPDREVDRDVLRVAGTHILEKRGKDRKAWWYPVDGSIAKYSNEGGFGYPPPFPRFTTSLDAAVALVERVLPGWAKGFDGGPKTRIAFVDQHDHDDRMFGARYTAEGPTPAIALILAALRALHAQEERR